MNSKGHLVSSLCKSAIRVVGCIFFMCAPVHPLVITGAAAFMIAEAFGVLEELFDKG